VIPARLPGRAHRIIDHGTPLLTVLAGSPLPGNGMSIEYPQWLVTPTTGHSGDGENTDHVHPGNDDVENGARHHHRRRQRPLVAVGGAFVTELLGRLLRAMAVDWGRKAEAYVLSVITPLATVVPPGTGFLDNVGALIGALDPATTPAGQLFVAMSSDVALPLISTTTLNGPAYWSGSINFGNMTSTVTNDAGLLIFIDWNLPVKNDAGRIDTGAPVHVSPGAPADIRVVDVSLLGLDGACTATSRWTPEYPDALAIMTLVP
jgi:hypothetical protein